MRTLLSVLSLLILLTPPALSLPGGAPQAACTTLEPSHGTTSQTTPNPYQLVLDEFMDPEDGTYYYIPGVTYTSK